MIEGFKPHSEAVLAVYEIFFSKEQCGDIASKYNIEVHLQLYKLTTLLTFKIWRRVTVSINKIK